MTVQDEIRQRIEKDVLLARLRRKIDTGKADFNDTFLYSDRAGKLLGEIFSRRLPDIPLEEREALCVELLRDRYTDINQLIDRVQRVLDEAQNLHIAPQHAPFKNERAHKIGNATADPTVPVETQQRRAESAPATMTRAMHDDRMKKEADFRSRAGLQCYITRKTDGKCCEWCDKMAGRYEYHSEPKDIYRRHDNCGCSVTYENGRQRQDVWSKREWEAPEPGAGAGDPVVFTKEQAEALQEKHVLTISAGSDTIMERSIHGETVGGLKAFGHSANTGSDLFSSEAKQNLRNREKEIANNRTEMAFLFSNNGTELFGKPGDANSVTFSPDELSRMAAGILTHNHPDGSTFSPNDVSFLLTHGLSEIRVSVRGGAYILQRTAKTIKKAPSLENVKQAFYDYSKIAAKELELKAAQEGWTLPVLLRHVDEEAINRLAVRYKLSFRLEVFPDE